MEKEISSYTMNDNARIEKAKDLLGVLGIWGMSRLDAVSIAYHLMNETRKIKTKMLPNALAGTGLRTLNDKELEEQTKQRIFHEPRDRTS